MPKQSDFCEVSIWRQINKAAAGIEGEKITDQSVSSSSEHRLKAVIW